MSRRVRLLALASASACGDDAGRGGGGAGASGGGDAGGGGGAVCPPSGVLAGPWSLRFDASSVVLRYDACAAHDVAFVVSDDAGGGEQTVSGAQTEVEVTTSHQGFAGVPPDLPGTRWTSEATVTGLAPGACYRYAVAAEPSRGGRFCTAKPSGAPLSFMAIGDTNPAIAPTEDLLAHAVARQPDFVLHLGDIQYYSSVLDSWSQWFISMQPMLSAGAFEPAIGNHESENPTEYADYYDRLFADAGFDGNRKYYRFESGGVWFFSLDTEQSIAPADPQGVWLQSMLADAAAQPGFRGSVVFMHRTLITVGDAGSEPALRALYEPIFEQHGVKLVLQGHMHGYERFVSSSITYVTSGGGGGLIGNVDENVASRPDEAALRVASAASYNAVVFDVGAATIDGAAIDETGTEIDTFTLALP